jgi:hypothetical protein
MTDLNGIYNGVVYENNIVIDFDIKTFPENGEIYILEGATHIENFKNSPIKKLVMPNSLTSISTQGLCGSNELDTVIFGKNYISITSQAFECDPMLYNFKNLYMSTYNNNEIINTYVYRYKLLEPKYIAIENFQNGDRSWNIVYNNILYLNDLKTTIIGYENSLGENIDLIEENNLENILFNSFKNCNIIKSIIFPNSLKNIGISAFEGCENLGPIFFPKSILNIGNKAFNSCPSLIWVVMYKNNKQYIYNYNLEEIDKTIAIQSFLSGNLTGWSLYYSSINKNKTSTIYTEYDSSMKQLNQAKSNPSATNYASNEYGINSPYNTNNYRECGQRNCL